MPNKLGSFLIFSLIFLSLVFVTKTQAFGATIYSNYTTGNDTTGNGSIETPYKTFHKAYTIGSTGDVLDLTGTFSWGNADETGDAQASGMIIGKDLTLQNHGADQTIFQSTTSSGSGDRRVFTISAGFSLTINNATIRYGRGYYASGGCLYVPIV